METKNTALEQLIEWIDSDCTPMDCVMKAKELLKVEKEQIQLAKKESYNEGWLEATQYIFKKYKKQ